MNAIMSDSTEDSRIREKFFKNISRTFKPAVLKYGLGNRRVLDIGCGYGQYLAHFGTGSLGIDANPKMVDYCVTHGLSALCADVDAGLPVDSGTFDVVWCSNFLEHAVSPHALLRGMHEVLCSGGLIFVKVPLIPHPIFEFFWRAVCRKPAGYHASEHLYAYTSRTVSFIIERAGFELVERSLFWPSSPFIRRITDAIAIPFGFTGTFVARKREDFAYPAKRPV